MSFGLMAGHSFDKTLDSLLNSITVQPHQNHSSTGNNGQQSILDFWEWQERQSDVSNNANTFSRRKFQSKSASSSNANHDSCSISSGRNGTAKSARNDRPTLRNKEVHMENSYATDSFDKDWMRLLQSRSGFVGDGWGADNLSSINSRSIFTAGSSDANSIAWADDAVEGESTDILSKQWAEVEQVFYGLTNGQKPKEMSQMVFQEVLQWKRAFNPLNNHKSPQDFKRTTSLVRKRDLLDSLKLSPLSINSSAEKADELPTPTPAQFETAVSGFSDFGFHDENEESPSPLMKLSPISTTHFVQSWLEKLTVNFNEGAEEDRISINPDHDPFPYPLLSPTMETMNNDNCFQEQQLVKALSTNLESNSRDYLSDDDDDDNEQLPEMTDHPRRLRVQRPISSRYINRVFHSGAYNQKHFNPENGYRAFGGSSTLTPSVNGEFQEMTGQIGRRPSASWSRHCESSSFAQSQADSKISFGGGSNWGEESQQRKRSTSNQPPPRFISRLLLDQLDEQLPTQSHNS